MKNLRDFINESQDVNESKEEFTLQFCDEDGTAIDETSIRLDTHGVDKDDFLYYNDLPAAELNKFEKQAHKLLKKANQDDPDIRLICIVQGDEGVTVDEL